MALIINGEGYYALLSKDRNQRKPNRSCHLATFETILFDGRSYDLNEYEVLIPEEWM